MSSKGKNIQSLAMKLKTKDFPRAVANHQQTKSESKNVKWDMTKWAVDWVLPEVDQRYDYWRCDTLSNLYKGH